MDLEIISMQRAWDVVITPQVISFLSDNDISNVNFNLEIDFDLKKYEVPFQIVFERNIALIVDDDFNVIGEKAGFIKRRVPKFHLPKLVKDNFNDPYFHVLANTVCLLNTFEDSVSMSNFCDALQVDFTNNSIFFLEKDELLKSNSQIEYIISNAISH